ncbi:DNA gyrase inhibitor YacG [Aliiroseovarius lamellibrachiae]|uniref:DNA gyrase inhibitor YacG n=1 Tax=Aliiroseovarius lamellibrachiae TaxID=1924933 RepID=UPI001BDFC041|nr:DNA gyrase inhibitor YacG [Aliiroseovarius lamellibrachiae]MBT2130623.1 DNA gyrase inhibitor YacG [Aliiroseovarius lamellibrachiae]
MSCPICSKNTDEDYRPFCSRRCADVDLGRWLNGSYCVPAETSEDLDEAANALADAQKKLSSRPH